ncbi:MAG: hypothetical protein LBD30_00420 [Verrucomicrobiales bacterium]|jgi:hypothetical protein|nr:hypothetical protein [Verrucomicrobiales bacterium]
MTWILLYPIMRQFWLGVVTVSALGWQAAWSAPRLTLKDVALHSSYPVKRDIVTTYFWIGQGASNYSDTTNHASAWDLKWTSNYGGVDHPRQRSASAQATTLPQKFAPTRNPFYVALPFNDTKYPKLAAKHVPWWNKSAHVTNPGRSQCRGRWVMIEFKGRVCFAQWEDVGPLRYDHVKYVFGNERPTQHTKAGLDVSPAVRDYLGMSGLDKTNWRFVDNDEVPYGPWIEYAEQAILFSAIKSETKQRAH